MKRYLGFYGIYDHPGVGVDDLKFTADDVNLLIENLMKHHAEKGTHWMNNWSTIYDSQDKLIIWADGKSETPHVPSSVPVDL